MVRLMLMSVLGRTSYELWGYKLWIMGATSYGLWGYSNLMTRRFPFILIIVPREAPSEVNEQLIG